MDGGLVQPAYFTNYKWVCEPLAKGDVSKVTQNRCGGQDTSSVSPIPILCSLYCILNLVRHGRPEVVGREGKIGSLIGLESR